MKNNTQTKELEMKSLRLMTISEMENEANKHQQKMDLFFDYNKKRGYITINVSYPYHIKLSRIPDHEALVHWIEHLTEKEWMNSELLGQFIQRIYEIKGWDLHRRSL
jgi:hypothetical protein